MNTSRGALRGGIALEGWEVKANPRWAGPAEGSLLMVRTRSFRFIGAAHAVGPLEPRHFARAGPIVAYGGPAVHSPLDHDRASTSTTCAARQITSASRRGKKQYDKRAAEKGKDWKARAAALAAFAEATSPLLTCRHLLLRRIGFGVTAAPGYRPPCRG